MKNTKYYQGLDENWIKYLYLIAYKITHSKRTSENVLSNILYMLINVCNIF